MYNVNPQPSKKGSEPIGVGRWRPFEPPNRSGISVLFVAFLIATNATPGLQLPTDSSMPRGSFMEHSSPNQSKVQLPAASAMVRSPGFIASDIRDPSTGRSFSLEASAFRFTLVGSLLAVGFAHEDALQLEAASGNQPFRVPAGARGQEGNGSGFLIGINLPFAPSDGPIGRHPNPYGFYHFVGSDAAGWHRAGTTFGDVAYENHTTGLGMVFVPSDGGLKYDLLVAAGTDLSKIVYDVIGAQRMHTDSSGQLNIITRDILVIDRAPVAELPSGEALECRYVLPTASSFAFDCPGWDGSTPLLIDPDMTVTTFGEGNVESVEGVARNSTGVIVLAGQTGSAGFAGNESWLNDFSSGAGDIFVALFAPDGKQRLGLALVGGSGQDVAMDVALGDNDQIMLVGWTNSTDFPTTTSNRFSGGASDAFVLVLASDASSILYSSYLGGSGGGSILEYASAVSLGSNHTTLIVGVTGADDFPGIDGQTKSSQSSVKRGFITEIPSDRSGSPRTMLLPNVTPRDVSVSERGDVIVAGELNSGALQWMSGPWDVHGTFNEAALPDGILLRLTPDLGRTESVSQLGGGRLDQIRAAIPAVGGSTYVAGITYSEDFPVTAGAASLGPRGSADVFLANVNGSGDVAFSVALGGAPAPQPSPSGIGSGQDVAFALALSPEGYVQVAGTTTSPDYPTTEYAAMDSLADCMSGFLTILSAEGTQLLYSSYVGGWDVGSVGGLALGPNGSVFIAGSTGGCQKLGGGNTTTTSGDAFLAALRPAIRGYAQVAVSTSPVDLPLYLDGRLLSTPAIVQLPNGSTHVLTAPLIQDSSSDSYAFDHWSGGGGDPSRTFAAANGSNYVATYRRLTSVDFALWVRDYSPSVQQGGQTHGAILVGTARGYDGGEIWLDLSSAFDGINGRCAPCTLPGAGASSLLIIVDIGTQPSRYNLSLVANNSYRNHSVYIPVEVVEHGETNEAPFVVELPLYMLILLVPAMIMMIWSLRRNARRR